MDDNTQIITKPVDASETNGVSTIFGISLRGILALILVSTLCGIVGWSVIRESKVEEKLVDGFILVVNGAIAFYFVQSKR